MRPLLLPLLFLAALLHAEPPRQAAPPQAQTRADPAFDARVKDMLAVLRGTGAYTVFFAPSFVAQVPKERFAAISAQLIAAHGPARAILGVQQVSPWVGLVRVQFGDAVAMVRLIVDPQPPHQVTGLLIQGFEAPQKSLEEVVTAIRALPGETGFALARLEPAGPRLLVSQQPERPLAIGSAFKLVILSELVRSIQARERKWDDLVTLDGAALPGGGYTMKPKGTQVSYRELATQMVSVSDNSATDILLKALGREHVEAMMPVLGIQDPARNRPFLSTLELFKLKGIASGELGRRFAALNESSRRAMLGGEVAAAPVASIAPTLFKDGKPVQIDTLEWFESPADLVRVFDWFRRNLDPDLAAVLSKNPGVPETAAAKWAWIGYKGGQEPGVLNLSFLLRARTGDWYALTASWNDPVKDVDVTQFFALMTRAVELAAKS